MIIMIETVTRSIELDDDELKILLDEHGCPPLIEGQLSQTDRFLDWVPTAECEAQLRGLGEITDESTEYEQE